MRGSEKNVIVVKARLVMLLGVLARDGCDLDTIGSPLHGCQHSQKDTKRQNFGILTNFSRSICTTVAETFLFIWEHFVLLIIQLAF